jgi:hypothetical protein
MASIPHEIELMEQIAEELDRWARDNSKVLSTLSDGYPAGFPDSFSLRFCEVLEWLQYHKPEIARFVEREFKGIKELFEANKHECNDKKETRVVAFFMGIPAQELARKLRHIAQIARKEEKKGILKRLLKIIGAIICFFAALITILKWEPIKAFIDKILWPK